MTTYADLINEVHLNLLGFISDQEQLTTTDGFASGDTSFSVDDATQISTGLIEVDQELMWCTMVDPDANLVYVSIRGMYGTGVAAHAANAVVRNAPRFPRQSIANSINSVIRSCYPDIFAVATTTITANGAVVTYSLPAEVEEVLDVTYELRDASGYWEPQHRWALDKHANTTAYPTGKTLSIFEPVLSNRTLQVLYKKVPTTMSALSDNLSITGLDESVRKVLVYGACSELVGYLEPARLSDDSAEARFIGTQSAGSAINASRYFYQMFLQAKAEENRRLLDRYPPRLHWNR